MRFAIAKRLLAICLLFALLLTLLSCRETPPFESGKTAYEIAVENGFVGTEEEWLQSLQNTKAPYIIDVSIENGSVIVTYNDGSHQNLGALLLETDNALSFLPLPDGTYAVTAASVHIAGAVTVPEVYKDKPVTRVLRHAFAGCTYLFSLTLPNSITAIGEAALKDCSNLLDLTVPFLGSDADDMASSHLGYPFGANDYTQNAKYVPASLESVTVTGGTVLAPNALSGCEHIKSITLPDTLTEIGFAALDSCNSLTSLTLPFVGSTQNGSDNTNIGHLFGVTSYTEHATAVPTTLTSITLTNATVLARYALYGCRGLTKIYLPEALATIGRYAFALCPLAEAHFANPQGWQTTEGSSIALGDPCQNANLLSQALFTKDWKCPNN